MNAPSPRSTSTARRRRQNGRGSMPLSRSGSFLNSFKSFVARPLSWFGANDENVDENGKRRRELSREIEDIEEDRSPSKPKRARVDGPAHPAPPKRVQTSTSAYLDPPSTSLQPIQQNTSSEKDRKSTFMQHSATFGGLPSSMSRTMSIDPPSAFAIRRDPSMMPLSSPIEARNSLSLAPRELTRQPSTGPFRLRSSLTPQPSGMRQLRREASAPPPMSSLETRPIFVRPPEDEQGDMHNSRDLRAQKTMSLGDFADFNRNTRAPSRDRMLTSFESVGSIPSTASTSHSETASKLQLRPSQSLSEKTFHNLEMYKTPIVPSRYKDSPAIPAFLRTSKSHVPLPMTTKDRSPKLSLGLPAPEGSKKIKKSIRHAGKPYGGRGGISKMIEKRKAEEQEEQEEQRYAKRSLEVVEEIDEMDTDIAPTKRDVGVSARMSGSEEEASTAATTEAYAYKAPEIGMAISTSMDDPFMQKDPVVSGGRMQPYGRIGRTRVRNPGHRSVPLGRPSNRFSAIFDEDEDMDTAKTDVRDEESSPALSADETSKSARFEAPKDFSFAQNTKPVEHQSEGAKEPPLQSLPFSFASPDPKPVALTDTVRMPWVDTTVSAKKTNVGDKSGGAAAPKDDISKEGSRPALSDPAPILERSTTSSSPSSSTVSPSTTVTKSDTKEAKSVVPNFFANSALLSKPPDVKATASAIPFSFGQPSAVTPASASSSPKEADTKEASAAKGAEAAKLPFTFGKPAGGASSFSTPFGAPSKAAEATAPKAVTPMSLFGNSSKEQNPLFPSPKDTDKSSKQPASSVTPFSFGTSNTPSAVPKPLFGLGSASATQASPSSAQTSVPARTEETRSHAALGSIVPSDRPASGGTGEQKPALSFGETAAFAKTEEGPSSSPAALNINAPKPLFGHAPGSSMFSFGNNTPPSAPTAPVDAPKSTPSPFAFQQKNIFGAVPATPPATSERQGSPFAFGSPAQAPSSSSGSMFQFGAKPSETAPTSAAASSAPFSFNNPPRPVTPPSKPDEGMNMEESPTRMDTSAKPQGSILFGSGPTPVNPFGQPSTPSTFSFGQTASTSNPFAPKVENNFNRTSSAPTISTNFTFGSKSDQPTPPATAFGTPSNAFGQPPPSSGSQAPMPFTFGQTPSASNPNPFGAPSQSASSTVPPSTSFGQPTASTFTFGTPSNTSANPFSFGSQPSSPATMPGGLPQSPAATTPTFAFGTPTGSTGLSFNIGAPPPSSGGTPGRQVRKLPNRARPPPKR